MDSCFKTNLFILKANWFLSKSRNVNYLRLENMCFKFIFFIISTQIVYIPIFREKPNCICFTKKVGPYNFYTAQKLGSLKHLTNYILSSMTL